MSFGTTGEYATKKALREAVATRGAATIFVFDTALTGSRGTISIAELESGDVIVGPDVFKCRKWYATVKRDAAGKVVIA